MVQLYLSVNESAISRFLEQAALSDQRRNSFIYKALHTFIQDESLVSTAFIWKNKDDHKKNIVSVGLRELDIFQWLYNYMNDLSEFPLIVNERHSPLADYKMNIIPVWHQDVITGIWIIWGNKQLSPKDSNIKFILPYLEAITVIDQPREIMVHSNILDHDLIEAFQHKDPSAILAVLSLFRVIGDADFVYWGDIINNSIVITSHLGSKHAGFGFELPIGEGFGGKAALMKNMLSVDDYQNSPYRVERVSATIDREGLRSGIVLPIMDKQVQAGGLLYVTRREKRPFSLLQQLFLLRTIQSIEPIHHRPNFKKSFFVSNQLLYPLANRKVELRMLMEQQKNIVEIERWASDVLKGAVMVIAPNGTPYNMDRVNRIFSGERNEIPLTTMNGIHYGKLLISTSIPLEQSDWPDFIDDLKSACLIILERQILLHRGEAYPYSNWIQTLIKNGINDELYYLGLRYGLPVENGEVWMFAWEAPLSDYLQLQLEEITIKRMKRKMIFFDHFAVLLIGMDDERVFPSKLRDEMLQVFPSNIWLSHGATYDSFSELREALEQSLKLLKTGRLEMPDQFIVEVKQTGLDVLFRKGQVGKELENFANQILEPVIEYDAKNQTTFTQTLVYNCLLQSPDDVANYLFIHKNTVLYRVKRAKEILNIDIETPKNRIALELAAYQWIKREDPSFLRILNSEKNESSTS